MVVEVVPERANSEKPTDRLASTALQGSGRMRHSGPAAFATGPFSVGPGPYWTESHDPWRAMEVAVQQTRGAVHLLLIGACTSGVCCSITVSIIVTSTITVTDGSVPGHADLAPLLPVDSRRRAQGARIPRPTVGWSMFAGASGRRFAHAD